MAFYLTMTLKLTGTTLKVGSTTLLEPPLDTFKAFVEYYNLAFSLLDPEDTLSTAWAYNDDFRDTLVEALMAYGVDKRDIHSLSATQMTVLLLADGEGNPGLIFQQNSAYPKPLSH